jgi:hypothetical protein
MTNQEVSEFMQRFLDDDLNENELEALMEHIRQSPASAAVFERLQRLDSELEQLPKVIPPMSIVDSILPRLELAGLVDHPPVIGTVSTNVLPDRVVPMERRANRVNYRLLGGVVAAGIVLTLFFTNFSPQMTFQSADEDTTSKMSLDTMMAPESNAKIPKKDAAMKSDSAEPKQQRGTTEEKTDAAERISTTPAADTAPPKSDLNAPMYKDAAEAPSPWVDKGKASRTGALDAGVAPDAPEDKAPSDSEPPVKATEEPLRNQIMATETEPLPSVASPNEQLTGTVTAVAEGGQQIIIYDLGGNQVYESDVYQGLLNELTWSPDSTQLHFEVIVENESTVHMTIHVTAQTESIKTAE